MTTMLRLRKSTFIENQHPREPGGSPAGGQFVHRYKMTLRPPGTGTVPDVPYQYEPSAFEEHGFIRTQAPLSLDDVHHYTLHEHPEEFSIVSPGQRRIDKYVGVVEWTGSGVKVVDHPKSSRYPIGSEIRANADQFRALAPDTDLNRRVYLHEEWRNDDMGKAVGSEDHAGCHAPKSLLPEVQEQINKDSELNPKVKHGVAALNKRGIRTTLSGDLYGKPLAYIDVHHDHIQRLNESKLPQGWKLLHGDASTTHSELMGAKPTRPSGTRTRLARLGQQPITPHEGRALAGAFNKSFDEHQHPRAHAGETGKYHGGEFVPAHGVVPDDIPDVVKRAVVDANRPNVDLEAHVRAYGKKRGEWEWGLSDKGKRQQRIEEAEKMIAQAQGIAHDNGWDWDGIVEKIRTDWQYSADWRTPEEVKWARLAEENMDRLRAKHPPSPFAKSFDESQHPRAHAGATGHYQGGEFVPAHHTGGGLFGDDEPATHLLGPVVHDLHALYPQDGRVHEIPTGVIEPDYSQDRSREEFSDSKISELAESMKRGLDQPIIVRPIVHPSGEPGFRVIAGERRYSAAKLLGWKSIRAQVRDVTDREAADIQLRENTARKDLNPMEEAKAFQSRIDKFGMTPEEIGKIAGKSTSYVTGRLALNSLTWGWQKLLNANNVQLGWAQMVAKLSKPSQDAILFEANKWPEEKWTTHNIRIAVQERALAESLAAQTSWEFGDDPIGDLTAEEGVAGGKIDKERTKKARDKAERVVSAMGKLLDELQQDDAGKLAPLAMAHKLGGWIDILERQRSAFDELIANAKAAKASKDTTGSFARYLKTADIKATSEEIQSRVSEKAGALQNQIANNRRKLNRVEERLAGLHRKRGMDAERQKFNDEKKMLLGKIAVLEDQKSKVRSVLKKAVDLTIATEDREETVARVRMFKSIEGVWLTRQWENALVPQEFAA